jgi:uncharacterized membrane protein YsdA (DUF1294 family)
MLPSLVLFYVLASAVCFAAYARDKAAARRRGPRTPERRLLLLGLAGGWPGGLLAQQVLRHKTAKASFQGWFWCSVAAHVAGAAALAWFLWERSA